jgi:predicted ribosome quality control (RQC) complex YloA/Tae2 family protein
VSNPIRYDSLLVHYLAAALHARLEGRLCRPVPTRISDRTFVLPLDRSEALLLDLHPARGHIRLIDWSDEGPVPGDGTVIAVHAPHDERRLVLRTRGGARFRPRTRDVVVELHTHHWNIIVADEDGRIASVTRPRTAGGRVLRPGSTYEPPAPRSRIDPRAGVAEAHAAWRSVVGGAIPGERVRAAQQRFAWLGPVSVRSVLGSAVNPDAGPLEIDAAFGRWLDLARLPPADPILLATPEGAHPFPFPLPDVPSQPVADLLVAMEISATPATPVDAPRGPTPPSIPSGALDRLRHRLDSLERRAARLRERLTDADDAARLRLHGDLLLANLAAVPRGAGQVELSGWDGAPISVALDPARSAVENADRYYRDARALDRAAARIPTLLEGLRREIEAIRSGVEGAERGDAVPEHLLARSAGAAARGDGAASDEAERLPYRTYRTSGGLEVRVGRGSGDNDRLTFHHARPVDVWLHAQSVPGSHVILRWSHPDQAPPARDLAEAAGLAAWFSKARTSGTVAVDWTRRKHVRKPRGAGAGRVITQRVRTLFVEPDPALARRLGGEAGFGGDDDPAAAGRDV